MSRLFWRLRFVSPVSCPVRLPACRQLLRLLSGLPATVRPVSAGCHCAGRPVLPVRLRSFSTSGCIGMVDQRRTRPDAGRLFCRMRMFPGSESLLIPFRRYRPVLRQRRMIWQTPCGCFPLPVRLHCLSSPARFRFASRPVPDNRCSGRQ